MTYLGKDADGNFRYEYAVNVNWEGCTNDINTVGATTPRITNNLDLNGAWFAGDNPA